MTYNCKLCNFNTIHTGNYERHLMTKKHLVLINQPKLYNCELCNFKNNKNNKFDYTCHLLTKKHLKNVEKFLTSSISYINTNIEYLNLYFKG